ncbi:hypothetical protein CASFOL_000754 [Castilleja foliolosa]|uniref:Uncharacterized protein n=1 Tax=Castilleja foliolosa TaxID=1961234 RepID=A0ABD3EKL1_9LAMI
MVHHTRSIEARRNKETLIEKQNPTVEEFGDFDDSSDEDYILPEDDDDVSIESDAPSEELEDIEGSSEDDIFMERAFTKKDRVNNKSTSRNNGSELNSTSIITATTKGIQR